MAAPLILASGSAIRAAVLRAAGVAFEVERPRLDEEALKAALRAEGLAPRDQADALAEAKAVSVSRLRPGLVIGCDQMLILEGAALDKPRDLAEAAAHLRRMRGRSHQLLSAVVAAAEGRPLWRHVSAPRLTMRDFSDGYLQGYLDRVGPQALLSVGAYQLEGEGIQLFSAIEGDYFSILGLPLLPLLEFLRANGIIGA